MLKWKKCPEPPELPASLPQPPVGVVGKWWWCWSRGQSFYVFVTGDGGPAPFCVTVYLLPDAFNAARVSIAGKGRPAHTDRYPTLPELWEIVDRFTLKGSLLGPSGPGGVPSIACSGSRPPETVAGDGTCFQMRQFGGLAGTPSDTRYKLASAGRYDLGTELYPGANRHG